MKIAFYVGLSLLIAYMMPIPKNWQESYSQKHNWPYGAEVTRDIWQDLFLHSSISEADKPIWNTLRDNDYSTSQLYVIFDRQIVFDSLDRSSLLDFVSEGNSAFIVADRLDSRLMDTLKIRKQYRVSEDFTSIINGMSVITFDQNFFDSRDSNYTFTIKDYQKYFTDIDTVDNDMIALAYGADRNELTYVKIPFGDGFFYLHNQPLLLTNYYVLSDEGKRYLEHMTSYLPSIDVIWDQHYKAIEQSKSVSPLNVVLSYETMRWAYWITVLGLLLFFVFRMKRRQRIIPVAKAPANDTLDFARTMGSLYYNSASNKTLAQKKIVVLKEYLSRKLYMNDIRFVDLEIDVIVSKTDHSNEEIEKLFKVVNAIHVTEVVSDGQLKVLNKLVNMITQS